MDDPLKKVIEDIGRVLGDDDFQRGVSRASVNAQVKAEKVLSSHPYLVELAKEVRKIKEEAIKSLDKLVDQAIESLKSVGATPFYAETAEDAREYVGRVVGSGKIIVMSKSMAAEEIGLREYLESLGNEVWETDLGQLLVQLSGERPMHTVAPAIHLTREKAAELVRERLGVELGEEASPEEIVAVARKYLREKFYRADVGISGCNALAASTGSIVLVENEGNIRLVTGLPPVHIALAPVDKVVPGILDAFKVALVQAAYAALYPPTYISVISGPSSTGDIELVRVYGAHGPREIHVVLIDNGRMKARSHPF